MFCGAVVARVVAGGAGGIRPFGLFPISNHNSALNQPVTIKLVYGYCTLGLHAVLFIAVVIRYCGGAAAHSRMSGYNQQVSRRQDKLQYSSCKLKSTMKRGI